MATVSDQLRQARERQQLDIYQVAEITKIKTDHLRALESGNFAVFSAPVYIRGFVRTYATMLKLNVQQVLGDLEAELGHSSKFREPPPLGPKSGGPLDFLMLKLSRLNLRSIITLLAILLFLTVAALVVRSRNRNPDDPLKKLGPGMYQANPAQSGDTLPLPPAKRP
jgi:cytoskeletal protein RodZ